MWHNLWLGNALHFLLQTIKRNASKELCSLMTLKEISNRKTATDTVTLTVAPYRVALIE